MIDGLVIKGVASRYKVDTADGIVMSYARGKLKIDGEIRVGDKVGVEKQGKDFVIAKVYERKNALIRPYVANVDVCFIVIAPVPAPDFMLVDKIIVNARTNGIEPVLLINKTDIADESFVKCTESDYRDVLDVIATSAKTKLNKDKIFEKMIISSERTWLLKISDKEVQYKTIKQIPTVNNSHKHKTI